VLDENSFVVDLGAFRGDFSKYILDKYDCRVDAYDPLNGLHCTNLEKKYPKFRFINKPVFDGSKVKFDITINTPSSNIFVNDGEEMDSVDIRDITKEHIDLMKVNIEGAEMVVLRLADLDNVAQLLVEFHLFRGEKEAFGITKVAINRLANKITGYGFKMKLINDAPAYFFYGKT
jgi:FkbM family methyltransferase